MQTYQEECVCHESVTEHSPTYPTSCSLAAVGDGSNRNGNNDTDEFVARVSHQIVDLALRVDVQEVPSQPKQNKLQDDDNAGVAESNTEQLGLKLSVQTRDHRGKQDVSCEGHHRDVNVRAVDVVPRRQERCATA
jgi:hypothetical protein